MVDKKEQISFWNEKKAFSTRTEEWETPLDLYNKLNNIYKFTLDPCCTKESAKCDKYYTKEDNGFIKDWSNEVVFMNPPYGRQIGLWIEKAYKESLKGAIVVCLIPARTDTKYWHNFIFKYAKQILFIKGRISFINGNKKAPAPFPSAIIEFNYNKIPTLQNIGVFK